METNRQWCDRRSCPDFGKIGTHNIHLYSHAERRFYCTTCHQTFSADKGTFFETLRSDRHLLLDVVAMMVERTSLRAISRIKHCKLDTIRHWLDLAGQHAASVSDHLIHSLHITHVQIDELWTFVKKRGAPSARRSTRYGRCLDLAGHCSAESFACGQPPQS